MQTQLHVLTRLRLAEELLARLGKAHSAKDYADLGDFAARAGIPRSRR
jgi:hypothetical protein